MPRRFIISIVATVAALMCSSGVTLAQTWNSSGLPRSAFEPSQAKPGPAPRRDLTGTWDAGAGGIQGPGHVAAPFTPWAQEHTSELQSPCNLVCRLLLE